MKALIDNSDPLLALRLLAARYSLGLAESWDLPPAADRALQAGIYSDALAELASKSEPVMSMVGPLFERAMSELGEGIPSQLDAAWTLTRYCVEQIVQSTSSPIEALEFLWWKLMNRNAVPPGNVVGSALDISQLMAIYDSYSCPNETYYVAEQREVTNEAERTRILDRLVREEAHAWLERHPI